MSKFPLSPTFEFSDLSVTGREPSEPNQQALYTLGCTMDGPVHVGLGLVLLHSSGTEGPDNEPPYFLVDELLPGSPAENSNQVSSCLIYTSKCTASSFLFTESIRPYTDQAR